MHRLLLPVINRRKGAPARILSCLGFCLLAFAAVTPVHAAYISVDDATFGAGSFVRDEAQSLDFLQPFHTLVAGFDPFVTSGPQSYYPQFPQQAGRSYDDVSQQFGSGGDFEGLRYATIDEVIALVNGYMSPTTMPLLVPDTAIELAANGDPTRLDAAERARLAQLVDLLGITSLGGNGFGDRQLNAITGTEGSRVVNLQPPLQSFTLVGRRTVTIVDAAFFTGLGPHDGVGSGINLFGDETRFFQGHWLVHDLNSAPAAPISEPSLLALVVIGLAASAIRRRRQRYIGAHQMGQ